MMQFWWVNHNKTYAHEVGDGFLWSPKTSRGGVFNQTYENMRLAMPGDIVISFAGSMVRAVGVVKSPATDLEKPLVFGSVGEYWDRDGWFLSVEFTEALTPFRPKERMETIGPLLPTKNSPILASGKGAQNCYLAAISNQLGAEILAMAGNPDLSMDIGTLDLLSPAIEEQEILADLHLKETEKRSLVLARRGQGDFRRRVQLVEKSCRVTGVSSEKLLIASHIKPWKVSENTERLSGNNGLFLSPHIDKLFDSGLISFEADGALMVSDLLDRDVLTRWSINPTKKYGKFNEDQTYFLNYHHEEVFKSDAA